MLPVARLPDGGLAGDGEGQGGRAGLRWSRALLDDCTDRLVAKQEASFN